MCIRDRLTTILVIMFRLSVFLTVPNSTFICSVIMSKLVCITAVWLDTRTAVTVDEIIARTPGNNHDHLRVTALSYLRVKLFR